MKFTLSWLHDHLDTNRSLEDICAALNKIGLEVEGVEDPGKTLAPFRTAQIISAEQHPNADRLRVCHVNAGKGFEDIQIVCGAPNARAGLITVLAPVGTYVPGSDITIKAGKIRGEQSNGMMCSSRELNLGDDHDGIMELPVDTPIGVSYAEYTQLNDPVIEIAITPNRGDALSIRNIARDLSVAGMGTLKPLKVPKIQVQFSSALSWNNQYEDACPWILGRTIRNVKNGPSPEWLQKRLRAVGIRPISCLVDITNYFAFDLGRPLHVYDLDRIAGKQLTICRGNGEKFLALDEKEYQVTDKDCVMIDEAGVQSLAGLMGGEKTGVSENTTDIFLECALFDPALIALSGRRHMIVTDARQRFERGVDQALLPDAIELATQMIIKLCGGQASDVVHAGQEPKWQRTATLHYNRLKDYGGLTVSENRVSEILTNLGFVIAEKNSEWIRVDVPSWRNDIAMPIKMAYNSKLDVVKKDKLLDSVRALEGEADLVEEILRIEGLDKIPACSMPLIQPVPSPALTTDQERSILCSRLLAAQGLIETVNFSFVDHEIAARLGEAPESLRLMNPISNDMDQLRPTPLASILPVMQRNIARGIGDIGLFETGPAFTRNQERLIAAGARYGHMQRQYDGKAPKVTLWDVKKDVLTVLDGLGISIDSLKTVGETPNYYHPGRSGRLSLGPKNILAYFGELHPSLVKEFGFDQAPMIFEIMLDTVIPKKITRKKAPVLSIFQPLKRDFAFVLKDGIPVEQLLQVVKQADRKYINSVELFDVYRGDKVQADHKSVAVQVTIQPNDRTLKDEEIEAISQKIIKEVARLLGGNLR